MSIETKVDKNLKNDKRNFKFGRCLYFERCDLYYPHDYHCNQNRSLFLVNGSTIPTCYREKKE